MGYTASKTQIMVGLGVSAISDSWYGFAQNEKKIEDYYKRLDTDVIPVFRGHILNSEDLIIRRHILNLMCHFETKWSLNSNYFKELPEVLVQFEELETDGLILINTDSITVTEKGKPYVRNVCMAFDLLLQRKQPESQLFSMTI